MIPERKKPTPVEAAQELRKFFIHCIENETPIKLCVTASVSACLIGLDNLTLQRMADTGQRLNFRPENDPQGELRVMIELKPRPSRYQEAYEDLYFYTQAGYTGSVESTVAENFDQLEERTRVIWGSEAYGAVEVLLTGRGDPEAELPIIQTGLRKIYQELEEGQQKELLGSGMGPESVANAVAY